MSSSGYSRLFPDVGGLKSEQLSPAQMVDDDRQSVVSSVDEVSRKDEIEKFWGDNKHLFPNQLNDVHVTTMRRIVPQLLMETYPEQYHPYVRKVKGIWKKPPPGWPSEVEFVDPNNNMKTSSGSGSTKPKKKLLVPMLEHLVKKYLSMRGRQQMPVQVEAVTDEELMKAMDLDWDEDFTHLVGQLRPKLLCLQKNGIIDRPTFDKLQHVQGMWSCKRSYTAADIRDINRLNGLLYEIKMYRRVTDDQRAQLDAIAGASASQLMAPATLADITQYSVSGRQVLLVGDADGQDALTRLNINSRSSQNALLMPTDDTAQQQDPVIKPSELMMYVPVITQQSVAQQPGENVVGQLNIQERATGMEVNHLVQMRPQSISEESDWLDELLSGDGKVTLMETNKLPELDSNILQILHNPESSQSIGVTSSESYMQEDSVFQNGEQNQETSESVMSSISSALSSIGSGDGTCASGMALYSPSPHTTNTQTPGQGPLSPALFQQLRIDNGNAVAMAVSASIGAPVQQVYYMPQQVTFQSMEKQAFAAVAEAKGVSHGKRIIPSVVEDQESDDDDSDDRLHYGAPKVKKLRSWQC